MLKIIKAKKWKQKSVYLFDVIIARDFLAKNTCFHNRIWRVFFGKKMKIKEQIKAI